MDATRLDNIPSLCFDLIIDKGDTGPRSSFKTLIHVLFRE